MPTRVLVPSGVLGLGFDREALMAGAASRPDLICIDGGSTDSGPHYLGAGVSKYSRASTMAEWRLLLEAQHVSESPLVVGSAGTCGVDAMVDWMLGMTEELASEAGRRLKVAVLKCSQDPRATADAFRQGRIHALDYAPEVSAEAISSCANIVALAGAEQMGEAISTGADLVIAGRATDTAGIAAMPLMNGEDSGAAWHSAKIAECGALCSTKPLSGVVVVEVGKSGFSVEPVSRDARCTPETVSAHMLYENSDPFRLHEPGGMLDASRARYEAMDSRRVRVTGSEWIPADSYAVKLEGAAVAGYQTTILAVVRNPRYVERIRDWSEQLQAFVKAEIKSRTGREEDTYAFDFRLIGLDSALGNLEFSRSAPAEVGVLAIVTAESQEAANELAKLANPFLLHFPLEGDEELPTFAFPYSPAETERGRQYEFRLNHVLELDDPMDAFRIDVMEVGCG